LTSARLFRARDHGGAGLLLRASTRVTIIFESFAYFVIGSIILASGSERGRSASGGVAGDFAANLASASGARVVNNAELLTNTVGQSLIITTA